MGQIHPGFIADMLKHCERGEHPPLTVWEAQQLLTLAQRALAASPAPAPQEPARPIAWMAMAFGVPAQATTDEPTAIRWRKAGGDVRPLYASPAPGELGAVDAAAGASQGDSQ